MNQPLSVVRYPDSPDDFLLELRRSRLLSAEQLRQAEADFRDQPGEAEALADLMIERGWLTTHQAEQLFLGRGGLLWWGQYRILDCIARGGMSEVFQAEHGLMRRIVALKVLSKDTLSDPAQQEIHLAARLQHPNVVTAFDAGVEHGRTFLVMEFVDGLNLHRFLEESGPLPVGLACDFVCQAARALEYAHDQGLLHRDVKPANFMVALPPERPLTPDPSPPRGEGGRQTWPLPDGVRPVVKLLDLGIAQLMSQKSDDEMLTGTPDYLAPEIAEDHAAAAARSDLYSLGCTFFQLLTGAVPFPSDTWTETIMRHRFDPVPPLEQWRDDVPDEVQRILSRLLAKLPDDRYASACELIRDLDDWLAANGGLDTGATGTRLHRPTEKDVSIQRPLPETQAGRWREALSLKNAPLIAALILGALLLGREVWIRSQASPAVQPLVAKSGPSVMIGDVDVPAPAFLIEKQNKSFSTFHEAIAGARDGDVVTIVRTEPIHVDPIKIENKRLTIRTALGGTVCLVFETRSQANPWQPMLSTDRALTLEGIELRYASSDCSAPLLHCTGSSLRLQRCRIEAKDHVAPLSCRNVSLIDFKDCHFDVQSTALSVEMNAISRFVMTWNGCDAEVRSVSGALISLWSPETGQSPRTMEIGLQGNKIAAGCVIGFTSPSSRSAIHISAKDNVLAHRQALLSFSGVTAGFAWEKIVTWKGERNQRPKDGVGVRVEGKPIADSLRRIAK